GDGLVRGAITGCSESDIAWAECHVPGGGGLSAADHAPAHQDVPDSAAVVYGVHGDWHQSHAGPLDQESNRLSAGGYELPVSGGLLRAHLAHTVPDYESPGSLLNPRC